MSRIAEVPFTELIDHPKATVAKLAASARAVRLQRHDADDLVLTTVSRAEQEAAIISATTRMFVALMRHDGAALSLLVGAAPEAFPWIRFLPSEDVRAFVAELVETLRAAESVDTLAPVVQVISAWKHTAERNADPELGAQLTLQPARSDSTDRSQSEDGPATVPPAA